MKKKLTKRDLNLLLAIAGLAVFLVAYFLGYQKMSEKNTEAEAKLAERTAYYDEIKGYYANIQKYEDGIAEAKADLKENIDSLPKGYHDEDFLLYMCEINDKVGATLQNVTFVPAELVLNFNTLVDDKSTDVNGYRVGTSSSSTMTYEQFKRYLQYVYEDTKDVTFLDSVSLTYSADTDSLDCAINLAKYYIEYKDSEYSPVPAPNVTFGKTNLFGAK